MGARLPYTDLIGFVDAHNKFGDDLRRSIADRITRQLQLAFAVEVLPTESNRVSVDPAFKDQLGNMRPVISYDLPEYFAARRRLRPAARRMFQRLGAADYTVYDTDDYGYVTYDREGYVVRGGNHLAGTHIMGTDATTSVVDSSQRSWDHENLYLVGGGMASVGTSNITLTIAAMCFGARSGSSSSSNARPRPPPSPSAERVLRDARTPHP